MMVIYLHGNKINNFCDILSLGELKGLTKLTLHGNPIEEVPNYRSFMILLVYMDTLRETDTLHVLSFLFSSLLYI